MNGRIFFRKIVLIFNVRVLSIALSLLGVFFAAGIAGAAKVNDTSFLINPSFKQLAQKPQMYNKVKLKGIVIERLDNDTYVVYDGTGTIDINVPSSLIPEGGLTPKSYISFEGHVDVEWDRSVEIDVDGLTFSF